MEKKKNIFVNKYEYLRSYTRCEQVNFLKNAEIDAAINATSSNFKNLFDDEDDEEDFENDRYDSYEEYRINKLSLDFTDVNNLDIDRKKEDDPKIIEGIIIDKKAKEFIKLQYQVDEVIDYDEQIYKIYAFDNEKAAAKTQEDIKHLQEQKKSFIMFQPTFINNTFNNACYVTKCDAIVYLNDGECILIEVKGTTSSKLIHLLDFFFQKNVLLNSNNNLIITNYQLCLVKYCRANKNEVPFILSNTLNITKNAPTISNKLKEMYQGDFDKLSPFKQRCKLGKYGLTIDGILSQSLSEEEIFDNLDSEMSEKSKQTQVNKIIKNATSKINKLQAEFENKIDELYQRKRNISKLINLKPCKECKSEYKNCEYWLKCRELFKIEYLKGKKSLKPFIYSGNVVPFAEQLKCYSDAISKNEVVPIPIKDKFDTLKKEINYINETEVINKLKLLHSKSNRIYFDFESINTAIRPMDNVFPFNQIITQNSIIKTHNYYDEYFAIDMIIDPSKIDLGWIKSLIDNLFINDDAWYIVYNKNFECTRLKEMANLINEEEYYKKVKKINDNIFDLADFFNPFNNLILLNDLHGFYSIKKVLELIPTSILNETKTKSYHDLEVYNGAVAQEVTTKRFFNLIDDEQWRHIENELKTYCQNDVRAMIAVEKYIIAFLKENHIEI